MQRINFIEAVQIQFTYEQILKGAVILPFICGLIFSVQVLIGQRLDKQVAALTLETEGLRAQKARLMETSKPEMEQGPVMEIKNIFDNTPDWGKFFEDLSQRTPQNVWLLSIKVGSDKAGQKVNITGVARDSSDLASFLSHLNESPFFKSVLLSQSHREKATKESLAGQGSTDDVDKEFTFAIESNVIVPKE